MKRFLSKDRFQLDDHEKENLWLGMQAEVEGDKREASHQRAFGPVLGFTTAMAAALVLMVYLGNQQGGHGPDQPGQAPASREIQLSEFQVESGGQAETNAEKPDSLVLKPAKVRGQVRDKETGQPLANANIVIVGSGRGLITDSQGRFEMDRLDPEKELLLKAKYLGFEDRTLEAELAAGEENQLVFELEPVVVATLEAFDVEGAEYMVEVKSTVTEHTVSSETFDKFAIDSVEDALSKQAGVVSRAGELYVRGGRSSEVKLASGVAAPPVSFGAGKPGSVTGGTTAPNGEPAELMYFEHTGVNPFVATEEDNLSTFAVDVDNASYTLARRYIMDGHLPPKDAIRVEEFVNFFEAGYNRQTDQVFTINLDGAPSRFGSGYHLVRIGLQGQDVADEERKASNLVFLIDISGSMDRENRLGLVKSSLRVLLDELQEGDRVGIVVYGSRAEVRLEPTDISQRKTILAAINRLRPNGSTNAYEGLKSAYRMARENYQAHKLNRLILCSDGVANMGNSTEAEEMLEEIRLASDSGITLSTIGFGMGNYNDVLMEKLADQGDGNYYYVDKKDEAERVFRENLTGLLQTIARQVKVQVEFEEDTVKRWRLLGYENRDVADRDFRNDDVDAGEVGAGHQVTALYELKLDEDSEEDRLGAVHLRYEYPAHDTQRAGQVKEISRDLTREMLVDQMGEASIRYRLQMVVAEFAEILKGSYWAKESRIKDLVPVINAVAEELGEDEQVQELAALIRLAADLQED